MRTMDSNINASGSRKEKKTRRRLRLSCVECTKRRQKCDRTYPCSLCVSRGVSHLCRWETVPLARPAPARPPVPASGAQSPDPTIQELSARIASLEKALADQKGKAETSGEVSPAMFTDSPSGSSTLASNDRSSSSNSPDSDLSLHSADPPTEGDNGTLTPQAYLLGQTVYTTTSTLAQLSLGHHGEYIGRGSLICALHSISTGKPPRFLYAKSTDATSAYRESADGFSETTLATRVEQLLRCIPPIPVTTELARGFFADVNWRFGVPEQWFHTACSQMWTALEYPGPHGLQINTNWLSLLFSVLAFAPQNTSEASLEAGQDLRIRSSDEYFMCAMTARRISEDDYLNKPNMSLMSSAADGTVLACLAVPLLCDYLSERGRVSEAWKLVGNGIRNAEAVGMHRDPEWKQWQMMSEDEMLLRRRAWWGLVIWDKMYSFILGRPQMIRKEIFDVALPVPIDPNGTRNLFNLGRAVLIQLASIVGESLEKCFSVEYPTCATMLDLDDKLKQWEEHLPPEYQQQEHATNDVDQTNSFIIDHQRYTLITWYLISRVKLHVAALTGPRRCPLLWKDIKERRKNCVLLSMRLIRLQCDAYTSAASLKADHTVRERVVPGSNWFFEGCFSLFEATVALLTTLTRYPWQEKADEAEVLTDRAMGVFLEVVREEEGKRGEIARMAVEVLGAVRQEHWRAAQKAQKEDATGSTMQDKPDPVFLQLKIDQPQAFNVEYEQWYPDPSNSGIFGSSMATHYNLSAMRDRNTSDTGLSFAMNLTLRDGVQAQESPSSADIHMAAALQEH